MTINSSTSRVDGQIHGTYTRPIWSWFRRIGFLFFFFLFLYMHTYKLIPVHTYAHTQTPTTTHTHGHGCSQINFCAIPTLFPPSLTPSLMSKLHTVFVTGSSLHNGGSTSLLWWCLITLAVIGMTDLGITACGYVDFFLCLLFMVCYFLFVCL